MIKRNQEKVKDLHKDFQPLVRELLAELKRAIGKQPIVTDGLRTREQQRELFAKGRFGNKGPIVTWTLDSNHMKGVAVDIGFLTKKSELTYEIDWEVFGRVVHSIPGLKWGYAMWGVDKPHVEWDGATFGYRPHNYKKRMAGSQKEVNRVQALMKYLWRVAKFRKKV
jgi:hypothetical protein